MMKKRLSDDFCLVVCCGLSAVMVIGVVFWLDSSSPVLTSAQALKLAENSVQGYCQERGIGGCDELRVMGVSAPNEAAGAWHVEIFSPLMGPVKVAVATGGGDQPASRIQLPR